MELEITDCGQSGPGRSIDEPDRQLNLSRGAGPLHLVGIGGIGMSALAKLLLLKGVEVSGSDREENASVRELRDLGARITIGHCAENIEGATGIVISTAISPDNPELAAARARPLAVWHRSQLLAALCNSSQVVAVSGTHGKTTTTGMIAQILIDCGKDPSVVVGGILPAIGSNACLGGGGYFVAEADESDGTHTQAKSHIAVITNIEADHLENYPGGLEQIRENMVVFANRSLAAAVICADDPGCRLVRPRLTGRVVTYGRKETSAEADYTYESLPGFSFAVQHGGHPLGVVSLSVPGEHNKLNALAAIAAAMELGIDFGSAAASLARFGGVARRFQILGSAAGVTVVDDYAHHPTEIAATLQAARECQALGGAGLREPVKRIVALFQPHQPGRLRDFWEDFLGCFSLADLVLIADIYVARGKPIEGITSENFASAVRHGEAAHLPGPVSLLAGQVIERIRHGDMVLTIGAGDITKVGPEILRILSERHGDGRAG